MLKMGGTMHKMILISIWTLIALQLSPGKMQHEINAKSYCVLSMRDHQILDSYNETYTQSVASISKIMTAIVAIEEGELSDQIKVGDVIEQVDGSMLYVKKGEVYTLEQLLYGLLLRSGNDASVLIAEHIGGDINEFVKMMNEKAKEIGMHQTHFTNPSGLDEVEGNISSSCDMAVLTSYAMQNKTFRKIVATKTYALNERILWKNKNRFLFSYPYATGGKTGYTKKAKRTLVTTSKKKNMEVAVVTLRASDDFNFHETLHEQAYQQYQSVKVISKGVYQIGKKKIKIDQNIYATIPKNESVDVKVYGKRKKKEFHLFIQVNNEERRYRFRYE